MSTDIDHLRAKAQEAVLAPRWSTDMDAAPKDGTFILVFSPDAVDPEYSDPGIRVSNWEGGTWQGFPWRQRGYAVTHWMPLPPAPDKEE